MQPERKTAAVDTILEELKWWEAELEKQGRMMEAQRIHQRTRFDLEMIKEMGYCHGIENYSRHFTGRLPGEPPPTLLDYVPRDYLMFIDESHQTVPQVRGMWHGDRSRKQNLIEYGFRLPSALDNRPLTFEEFEHRVNQVIYVSATPGPVRADQVSRRGGGADHSPHGTHRSRSRSASGEGADRRSAARNSRAREAQRTRAGDHAHQAHVRRPGRVLQRSRRALPLHALRDRDPGAHQDPARLAQGRVRRADRHQPVARGTGLARSFAGRDSRRRQGRLSALGGIADPDHGPLRPQPERTRDSVR